MTNADLLDPTPDLELGGNTLDLGRSELGIIEHRHPSPMTQTLTLLAPPSALIVTRHPGEETRIREELERDGWLVKTCNGPGRVDCPLMRGERCSLRESVDAAVVFVDPKDMPGSLGTIPRLRCAADSCSPGVVAVEGSLAPARYSENSATVGSLRGPDAILSAIAALVGSRAEAT